MTYLCILIDQNCNSKYIDLEGSPSYNIFLYVDIFLNIYVNVNKFYIDSQLDKPVKPPLNYKGFDKLYRHLTFHVFFFCIFVLL